MSRVDIYFDYHSPYAYLGWMDVRALCASKGAELRAVPTLFPGLLNHWGQLGPAEIPPKRRWVFSDIYRIGKLRGITFVGPKYHPFNPLTALRLSLPEVGGDRQHDIIDAIYRAGWGRGIDLGSPEELGAALAEIGLDARALLEKTALPEVKEALKKNTEEAISRGVFGVPTMFVGEELFWGSDRIDHVALALDGKDPIDRAWVDAHLSRPKSADRREANAKKQ
jgi:2-hydroxychromene-2-carboxylate isomerase